MNNNLQQLKELALRYSKEFKNMSDDELKSRFIESFGIDKWNEEEMLAKLIPFGDGVANYLGIDPVPIVFEELAKEDSRIYVKEQYIAINEALNKNLYECLKCITHEYRHLYQLYFIALFKDDTSPLGDIARIYQDNFKHYVDVEDYEGYMIQTIELDAYAFTKVYFKKLFGLDIKISNDDYSKIVDEYINRYY